MTQLIFRCAAASGFLAVALGAFGAHGLRARLDERLMAAYQTGVEYHFYHTLALLLVAQLLLLRPEVRALKVAALAFLVGVLLFCGSLYGMALGGPRWLGPITPLGGVSFMVGWLALFWAVPGLKADASHHKK